VVAAAGAVDHSQLVDMASKAFAKLPSSGVSAEDLIEQVHL
jgi:predicted Zn-dependent peptidase